MKQIWQYLRWYAGTDYYRQYWSADRRQENVSGHIGYISPVSEFTPKSVQTTDLRTDLVYMIRVYADNPDKFLRQGMPTTVLIDLKDTRGK